MATVEQQQQPTAPSPFAPPSSPLSPVASTPVGIGSPTSFDVFPLISDDPPVRALNGLQYYHIHETEYTRRMPDETLFPWLHGVDVRNHQQNLFFGVDESTAPQHRGVTIVQADASAIACGLASSSPQYSLSSQSSTTFSSPSQAPMRRCQLVGAVLPHEILNPKTPDKEIRGFLRVKDQDGINLRNFKSQVVRYATVSDIIVYGENGLDESVLEIAKQMAYAQHLIREQRPNGLEYETFVIVGELSLFFAVSGLQCLATDCIFITIDGTPRTILVL
jgi:dual specificity MAP kinase phosphatase